MGDPAPYEYLLLCDGSTINETDYPELCAAMGGNVLPNLVGRVLQGDSVGGGYKVAGVPNITGAHRSFIITNAPGPEAMGAFNRYILGEGHLTWATSSTISDCHVVLDASAFNSIYGASTTVQPPAYTTRIYICYAG